MPVSDPTPTVPLRIEYQPDGVVLRLGYPDGVRECLLLPRSVARMIGDLGCWLASRLEVYDPDEAALEEAVDFVSNVNGDWADEFREWYTPGAWLSPARAAGRFVAGKMGAA